MRTVMIISGMVLLLLARSSVAPAFLLWGSNNDSTEAHRWPVNAAGDHLFNHWDLREFPDCAIPWTRGSDTPDMTSGTEFDQVAAAFDRWAEVSPAVIGFYEAEQSGVAPPWIMDGNNVIGWADSLPDETLAMTYLLADNVTGQIEEADIRFNDNWLWRNGPHVIADTTADVQSIAAHEIGHFIGIYHTWVIGDGTAATRPTMWTWVNPFDLTTEMRTLEIDDRNAANFLYTPDIGNMTEPHYPSFVHASGGGRVLNGDSLDAVAPGAEHIFGTKGLLAPDMFYNYEWLGYEVTGECESNQGMDPGTDGVTFTRQGRTIDIDVDIMTAADADGNCHDYTERQLYLNIWIDWNVNGEWEEGVEHVVHHPLPDAACGVVIPLQFVVDVPTSAPSFICVRARLDWGEDCGMVNSVEPDLSNPLKAAQFGEVEDYVVFIGGIGWFNHCVGNCVLTMTDQGILGFMGSDQSEGSGFIYPAGGDNQLYVGSIWVGESASYVANRDYDHDPDREWCVATVPDGHVTVNLDGFSDQDINAGYTDSLASVPRGLRVRQESWAWADLAGDDFVIVRYFVENVGTDPLSDIHVGLFLDVDIDVYTENAGGTDPGRQLVYINGGIDDYYVGGRLLVADSPQHVMANLSLIDNPTYVYPLNYMPDADKYGFLSAATPEYVVQQTTEPGDYSLLASAGPITLAPGEVHEVAFAIVGGQGLSELQANSDEAQRRYNPTVGVAESLPLPVAVTRLLPNTPNPFNPTTHVRFDLARPGHVRLSIYDVKGRLVRRLVNGHQAAGQHSLSWHGRTDARRAASSGIYYLQLEAGARRMTRPIVLLK